MEKAKGALREELSEAEEVVAAEPREADREEKRLGSSWVMLRSRDVEVISRFLNVAERAISTIREVISKNQG